MHLDIETIKKAAKNLKLDFDEIKDDLKVIIYTDGGSRSGPPVTAGAGIHGYVFVDKETKSNSNAPNGTAASKEGFVPKGMISDSLPKVTVLTYFDIVIPLGAQTNNFAELTAALEAIRLVDKVNSSEEDYNISAFTIISDSDYFVKHYNDFLLDWHENGYIGKSGKPLSNKELWVAMHAMKLAVGDIGTVKWVGRDSGDVGNERADTLATYGVHKSMAGADDISTVHLYQKDFGDDKTSLSPLLSEKRFFINREQKKNNMYFQLSMGARWPSNEEEKIESIGKRISDTCISVVSLDEPEPVLDSLSDFCREVCDLNGLMYGRLDFLNKGSLHETLKYKGVNVLRQKGQNIITESKAELLTELNPARLSFRLENQYEQLALMINDFKQSYPEDLHLLDYKVQDIAGQIYLIETDKKKKGYKLYDDDEDNSLVEVKAFVNDVETTISLTMDVDLPSKTTLRKLGKLEPEVYLLTWSDHELETAIYYACVFKIKGGLGIWMSAYSNVHFLKHN